ncbi:hypothetical protein Cni_G01797 [Canna indica]|uniref:Uncharacterized protein n=1 Tax=Canna indica TaxID=4628 RepID=A0AAQ3JQ62_9LILI|nr:hypothetical protein Cni_G01797 [Canna indica]
MDDHPRQPSLSAMRSRLTVVMLLLSTNLISYFLFSSDEGELKLAVDPHKLSLGYTPVLRSDELYLVLGTAYRRLQDELVQYMTYKVGGECRSD